MGKRTQTLDRGTLPRRTASRSVLPHLYCEGSSTQRCMKSTISWQFLAWNNLHFSEQEQTDELSHAPNTTGVVDYCEMLAFELFPTM